MSSERKKVPYSRPELGRDEEDAVLAVMRSGWLTTGSEALEFEREFAAKLDAAEPAGGISPGDGFTCLALSSATAGLHLGLAALNLPENSTVLLPSYTFAASVNAVMYNRLQPRFIDSISGGYHMDPQAVQRELELRGSVRNGGEISAIMMVHFAGTELNGDRLRAIARQYDVKIIEDAAHSFPGQREGGGYQGAGGDVGVYSFYANKTITTGEGGMLVTRSPEIADGVRRMRLHGISREIWSRYQSEKTGYEYDIVLPGYKYNMPDILAAIGRVQLRRAENFMAARRKIAATYHSAFENKPWILPPPAPGGLDRKNISQSNLHSWHIYSLMLKTDTLDIGRDEFIRTLGDAGIGTSVHFIPLHTMSYYKNTLNLRAEDFPNAMKSFYSTISLPIFPSLKADEQAYIIEEVCKIGDTHYTG